MLSRRNSAAIYGPLTSDKEERFRVSQWGLISGNPWRYFNLYLYIFQIFNIAFVPFNSRERVLPSSEVEARFLTGYINSSSPNAGASTFPYLHFHLFRSAPSIVAFVRLVARLATIKNILVRCGGVRERFLLAKCDTTDRKRKTERNEGKAKRRREERKRERKNPREAWQAAQREEGI